jgi:hypothetical protein
MRWELRLEGRSRSGKPHSMAIIEKKGSLLFRVARNSLMELRPEGVLSEADWRASA